MIFFGTSSLSILVLERLMELGLIPDAVVTVTDKPQGRKMLMTPPPLKAWAEERGITVLQFERLDANAALALSKAGKGGTRPDVFVVASYGKIIPQAVLDIPEHGCLNVHPSLLPKYRGASPMPSTILADEPHTGVVIIQMDSQMDHGPVIARKEMDIEPWPLKLSELEMLLAKAGADILAEALPSYLAGTGMKEEQDHSKATQTSKFKKEDGRISLDELTGDAGWKTYLRFSALEELTGIYFIIKADIRVKVKQAGWDADARQMNILRVTPEGKKEMSWKEFENYEKQQ